MNKDKFCKVFPKANQQKLVFSKSNSISENLFNLIHIDIWRKFPKLTHNN